MCIVIDMNVVKTVFNEEEKDHQYYKPVKDWILRGKGKMVVGGKTYHEELKRMYKFRKLYLALRKAGKVVVGGCDEKIDKLEMELKETLNHRDFDDPHIVALLIVSGCKVICSEDARAYPFFQKNEWYPKGQNVPKIYCKRSYSKSKEILSDSNIAGICLPCSRLNRVQQDAFSGIVVT
ncbi:hypothetical protein [Salinivibrio kushneri]|uniref:hypothetical protein n=1 Tax=Salinivibrio kushneri TaxID=1908198 RepID=UPI0009888623|nr:hypothetical protein [Salinivibrio kushneri]OOE32009.1 hypothetical protein BZG05_15970 [Salinivibrio kushneri]OOE53513.1 hypothetical protein BZG12_08745 [Salinivibrio kushneri]